MQLPDSPTHDFTADNRTIVQKPTSTSSDTAVREIYSRGNVPLLIGDRILAEVASAELIEGLIAAGELSHAELARMSAGLAESLSETVAHDCIHAELADIAADAAALFVLCLRRQQILDIDNIPACRVSFDSNQNQAVLTFAS